MRYELEEHLFNRIREGQKPRDVIFSMLAVGSIQNVKQAYATLAKWSRQGIYDYGVALDLGWLDKGAVPPRQRQAGER